MTKMIRFANAAQAIIFECELLGQISDGYWENSRPHDHWLDFSDVKVTHAFHADTDGAVIGKNFHTSRKYNFSDPGLLEIVGQRMINFVKFYTAFPNADHDFKNHWDFSYEGPTAQKITERVRNGLSKSGTGYQADTAKRAMKVLNVTNSTRFAEAMQKVDAVQYDMKALKKDLKQIKEIVNA